MLGNITGKSRTQSSSVDLGGLFFVEVEDHYAKLVSHISLSSSRLANILARKAVDGHEVETLALVCLPPREVVPQATSGLPDDPNMLKRYLQAGWCAPSEQAKQGDAKALVAAQQEQRGVFRLMVKVLKARGFGGRPHAPWTGG